MATFKKSEVLKAIESQFKKDFVTGLSLIKPQWSEIAMKVSSNTKVNTYGILSEFPKMREWVGKRQRKAMQAVGMSIENKLFESTVGIPRVDIEDDQVGLFRPIIQQAGQSAAELPDDLVFALLKKGKTTLCYDGQKFFDTDHPVYDNVDGTGSNTTQSNITTGSSRESATFYLFDTTNAIRPLIWQERTAPEITPRFDPEKSESVWNEDVYEWGVRARGAAGFGFWQLAHCVEQTELTAENIMAENEIVVEIDGKQHDNWKSYDIDSDFLIAADAFRFSIGTPSTDTVIPDFTGKEAKVFINEQLIMTGIVDTTQHSINKSSRTFNLNGRDKASILVDCSAPITNVKGLTLLDAVKKIVEPLGIKKVELKAEDNPTLDKVDIDIGETAWNAVKRCAKPDVTKVNFDIQVKISGITLVEIKVAIQKALADYFNTLIPGDELIVSQCEAVVNNLIGVVDRRFTTPTANKKADVVSKIEWFRLGTVSVTEMS